MGKIIFSVMILVFFGHASADVIYKVGVVPQFDIRKLTAIWQPILHDVEIATGIRLQLVGSPSIPEFEKSFLKGEFDFAYMNPYHAIVAHRQQGYRPILRDIKNQLYGIIVVKNDSPFKSLTDLNNKTIAFPAPNSLGATLIPRSEFARQHINIQPMYVQSHSSVYLNVLLGLADAGGGVQKTFHSQEQQIRNQLRILYQTEKVPPHPIVVHPRVAKEIASRFQQAFIDLGRVEESRLKLALIPIQEIGTTNIGDYAILNDLGIEKFYAQ